MKNSLIILLELVDKCLLDTIVLSMGSTLAQILRLRMRNCGQN